MRLTSTVLNASPRKTHARLRLKRNALLALGIVGLTAAAAMPASAQVITDGSLTVNIDNFGEFNQITLNGIDIDTSGFFQQYLVNDFAFTGLSPVVVTGSSAFYTASVAGFNVSVFSSILGPLASNPGTTNVLEQRLVFSNLTADSLPLSVLSYIDQDINNTTADGDTVAFDAAQQAVYATDSPQLFAAISQTDAPGATFGFDVGEIGTVSTSFPTGNRLGPTGPDDTAMAIGFNLNQLAANQTQSVTFRYLVSTNLSSVPGDFRFNAAPAVPEPSTWAGMGMASFALCGLMVRARRKANR